MLRLTRGGRRRPRSEQFVPDIGRRYVIQSERVEIPECGTDAQWNEELHQATAKQSPHQPAAEARSSDSTASSTFCTCQASANSVQRFCYFQSGDDEEH